jgi:hypothetical protein
MKATTKYTNHKKNKPLFRVVRDLDLKFATTNDQIIPIEKMT